jgi:phage tail sheath protein FI
MAPGVNNANTVGLATQMINVCEERGDVMTIIDPVPFASTIGNATTEAGERDSSYAAFYWPWVQIADPMTGKYVWVPQSAMMPGIYAFNDKVSAEWFAPAGLNRGGQETVIQAERKLTHANRDELYEANVNPVATFPGEGVVVWGQKTLQKKASALDRVNVRRLLINLKKFIASVSKYLVFENNTAATRNRFLSQVNPYMESVQQRQGLYAFKVVMDESNNTPDIIDRNIMKGDIFIQPAKAAEFIVIDFNIMPTGATFND